MRVPIPNYDLGVVTLDPEKTGFTIEGEAISNNFGISVSTAGDINGDGYDDVIVGAYGWNLNRGAVFVIYGGENTSFSNLYLNLEELNPATTGFTIRGKTSSFLGYSVSTLGDINNDGYDDIIMGAYIQDNDRGAAYVIYGGKKSSLSNLDFSSQTLDPATTGFIITGKEDSRVGFSVSRVGDVNGDGYDDIIVGAPSSGADEGNAYVIYGGKKSSLSNIDLSSTVLAPTTNGFRVNMPNSFNLFGSAVSAAGDIDNDGYDDVIIGARSERLVCVIFGGEKSSLSNIIVTDQTITPAAAGFLISDPRSGSFGYSVSTAGDVNKDGYDDILIGDPSLLSSQGAAYVIYGREKSSFSNIQLSSTTGLDPAIGFTIKGYAAGNGLGNSVRAAGDINKDGYDDIIIGAPRKNTNTGEAYVIYGKSSFVDINLASMTLDPDTTGFTITGSANNDYLGYSVSSAGDVNKDGFVDLIIGVYFKNEGCGQVLVLHSGCITDKNTCISVCQDCNHGRGTSNPKCAVCPPNCLYYGSDTSCEVCDLGYFLSITPTGGACKGCSPHCLFCTSEASCQTCEQGYLLSNGYCTLSDSPSANISYEDDEAKAIKAIQSVAIGAASVTCSGNSRAPLSALLSKIVQNTRYLNLTVTAELAEVYQTWNPNLISWKVPDKISQSGDFKTSSPLFARYGLGSPFLANFWPTLITLMIGLASFIICVGLKNLTKNKAKLYSFIEKVTAGCLNFVIVQAYCCMDDILFYLIIDIKTNPFNNFYSWLSFLSAIGFLALGCWFIVSNIRTIKNYQRIKNEGLAKKDMKNLKAFNERNKLWKLFYLDNSDADFWSQSTMAFLLIRAALSSFIIAVLFDYPLMQTAFLIILDGVVILFLILKKPFNTLRAKLAQYYFETVTILVHLCTFSIALQDSVENNLKTFLCIAIIYLNTALVTGGIGFMAIEIYKMISLTIKGGKPEKYGHISIQTSKEAATSSFQKPVHTRSTSSPRRRMFVNTEQTLSHDNFHLLSGFNQEENNLSFIGVNIQPPINRFNSSMNGDDFIPSDRKTPNEPYEPQRFKDPVPILIRHKNRKTPIQ